MRAVPESSVFDEVAERLEQSSTLDRLEARGTLRLALKKAGYDSADIMTHELCVVIERILPAELTARGIEDADSVCRALVSFAGSLGDAGSNADDSRPEAVFHRLGGG